MQGWIISVIIQLVLKFGFPWLVHVLLKIPNLPQDVIDALNKFLEMIGDPKQSNSAAKKMAVVAVRAAFDKSKGAKS